MPTVDLAATLLVIYDQWTLQGALNNVDAINTNDGSTSYFDNVDWLFPSRLLHSYQDLPNDAVVVNSLTQYATLGRSISGGVSIRNWIHRYNDVDYLVGSTVFPPAWTAESSVITFGGGGGWTVEKVNNSMFGIRYESAGLHDDIHYLITYHKVIVDYTASGMFAITFVIPLLGIISASFDRIMRQLLPHVRYTREELEKIRQDIRNAQRGYLLPVQSLNGKVIL